MAQWYTAADVFVNPTYEEVLGLVNLEAQACGTPVVTYDSGGSPECVDNISGKIVKEKSSYELSRLLIESLPQKTESSYEPDNKFTQSKMIYEYKKFYIH